MILCLKYPPLWSSFAQRLEDKKSGVLSAFIPLNAHILRLMDGLCFHSATSKILKNWTKLH